MRTVRTFTVSLLVAIGGALGVLAALSPAAADTSDTSVSVIAGADDTHW